ncbi:Crp/Fnr family transcriptional regulator [Brevundimonas sp.]|uniref:Crp/Fnr family transcriptional regulator n=1 Tax=Brevundimonas sp. TaxID=1871086 RepID=UPI002D78F286|nr:Crp/Fnr family transcriptional regulator [Brevundimonas sp.]
MALLPERNLLLEKLEKHDREAVLTHMSDFDFDLGHVFGEPGEEVQQIYFVDRGVISAVSMMTNGETVEAYMIGREGFTGTTAWQVPFRTSVRYIGQIAGRARRIEARKLRELSSERPSLRLLLATYDAALQVELEQSAPCNAVHRAEQRFAKWLLRAHDRADNDTLSMTQEFLANMLGAQRTTVNEAAQSLAGVGAISYARGKVLIKNRAALERAACECYAAAKAVADRREASSEPVPVKS